MVGIVFGQIQPQDFFNGLMAVPNLLALLALSGVVAAIDKE